MMMTPAAPAAARVDDEGDEQRGDDYGRDDRPEAESAALGRLRQKVAGGENFHDPEIDRNLRDLVRNPLRAHTLLKKNRHRPAARGAPTPLTAADRPPYRTYPLTARRNRSLSRYSELRAGLRTPY